jgi:hemolysin III
MDLLNFRDPVSAWTHCAGMILAVPATVYLCWRGWGSRSRVVGLLIFGLSLIYCYAGSTLFHAARDPDHIRVFHRLDHIGIYLLIAGSYTPVSLTVLRGRWRGFMLTIVWTFAALGIAMRVCSEHIPGIVSTSMYLIMGWLAVLCYFELVRLLSHQAMLYAILGGVLYSVGAVINLADAPILVPGVFGAHELFHCFVMAASLTHFYFMLKYVVPYRRLHRSRSTVAISATTTAIVPTPIVDPS